MVTVFPPFRLKNSSANDDRPVDMPTSPLPDTSNLEAGILQDEQPSRLSRVQDSVRDLLRASVFGSFGSSPATPVRLPTGRNQPGTFSPIIIPNSRPADIRPSSSSSRHFPPTPQPDSPVDVVPLPEQVHQAAGHQPYGSTHYQSTLFNNRAMTALDHPDLSDLSMKDLSRQKSQQQLRSRSGTVRPQHKRYYRGRRAAKKAACSRMLLCVLAAVLLGALVATYISVATTAAGTTTTFHVLFVLGIILAIIVFSHTALRLCITSRRRSAAMPTFTSVSSHSPGFRRPHHHARSGSRQNASITHTRSLNDLHSTHTRPDSFSLRAQDLEEAPYVPWSNTGSRIQPCQSAGATTRAFIPPAPIKVHILSSSSSLDLQEDLTPETHRPTLPSTNLIPDSHRLAAKCSSLPPPPPPPAYGRWRGSVRADPDLLHWVPSPTVEGGLPSPTYEQTVDVPPSYRTRESPPRRRVDEHDRAGHGSEMLEVGRAV